MKVQDMKELLSTLVDIQNNGSAPIEVKIGYVDDHNLVQKDAILLLEAPPCVISMLIDKGYILNVTKEGVIVDKL